MTRARWGGRGEEPPRPGVSTQGPAMQQSRAPLVLH